MNNRSSPKETCKDPPRSWIIYHFYLWFRSYRFIRYFNSCHPLNYHSFGRHLLSCHPLSCHPLSCHPLSRHPLNSHPLNWYSINYYSFSCHSLNCYSFSCHSFNCHPPLQDDGWMNEGTFFLMFPQIWTALITKNIKKTFFNCLIFEIILDVPNYIK